MTGYQSQENRIDGDGGVELLVHMPDIKKSVGVAQCKAWRDYKIGVEPVRGLLAAMTEHKVRNGRFITSGGYTSEAVHFAKGQNVKLVSGRMFLESILDLPEKKQKKLLKIAVGGDYKTPSCPRCGAKMVLREGEGEWRFFWGCPKAPRCKATLTYSPSGQ